ncbi:MAG: FGGY-family carbohydrate kinase, partial [Acidimicrobiales bacterium]
DAAAVAPLAASVPSSESVVVVPAFTGLGSPWWDPYARGTITGLSRGLGAAHVARAVVEAIAFEVRDVVDAMQQVAARRLEAMRVDGGAAVMDLLLQIQSDQLRVRVERPASTETTALGAATLAGLAEGMWGSTDDLASLWTLDAAFEPKATKVAADSAHATWLRATQRARGWASEPVEEEA